MSASTGSHRRRSLGADFGYVPGEPTTGDRWLRLNSNESPLPPSSAVKPAVAAAAELSHRYPHPLGEPLRSELAVHHGVDPDNIILGNGADDVLNTCFRAFCDPGDVVVLTDPTYPLLPTLAGIFSARVVVKPAPDDAPDFSAEPAALRFLVNPNSPTGSWLPPATVAAVLGDAGGVVVIDEAYADFAPESCLPLAMERDNWLVVRTFSKSYALAGMRVGYAVGSQSLIRDMGAVKDVYPLSHCAIAGARAALGDQDHHRRLVATAREQREVLFARLTAAGWTVLPSQANFVFARPPAGVTAKVVADALRERNILVRWLPQVDRHWLRISCGSADQNARLLAALGIR